MSDARTLTLTVPRHDDGMPVSRADALRAAFVEVAMSSRDDPTIAAAWLVLPSGERVDLSGLIEADAMTMH
jgi:hypothetical protein